MECRSVIDSLSDYLDGSLAAPQVQSIEAHLHQCSPCSLIKSDLSQICLAATELPLRTPSGALWTRICNEIELENTPVEARAAKKTSWWQSWSERKFSFTLPQLAGSSALAFSLMVFGLYHAFHNDRTTVSPTDAATAISPLPIEMEWQNKVQVRANSLNVRRAAWTNETRETFDNQIRRIDSSMLRLRQICSQTRDKEQQQLLISLYNEKLQLMEDFEKFDR